MGVDAGQARGAIRVSLGWTTTEADIDRLLAAWIGVGSSLLKQHAA
jgi:cysteine desulfurase